MNSVGNYFTRTILNVSVIYATFPVLDLYFRKKYLWAIHTK